VLPAADYKSKIFNSLATGAGGMVCPRLIRQKIFPLIGKDGYHQDCQLIFGRQGALASLEVNSSILGEDPVSNIVTMLNQPIQPCFRFPQETSNLGTFS
jgi:hypothetical protein